MGHTSRDDRIADADVSDDDVAGEVGGEEMRRLFARERDREIGARGSAAYCAVVAVET
jgi:hypothetical protein